VVVVVVLFHGTVAIVTKGVTHCSKYKISLQIIDLKAFPV
jgi:hypothetical protein